MNFKNIFSVVITFLFISSHTEVFSQFKMILLEDVPIYKPSLWEKEFLQCAFHLPPNKSTGKFTGVIPESRIKENIAYFKYETYSTPKSRIYGYLILFSEIEEIPEVEKSFRNKFLDLEVKFWRTFEFNDKTHRILDKKSYLENLDSLDKLVSPYYEIVEEKGREILENIKNNYTYINKIKTSKPRNLNRDKLTANKFWEPSYGLFDPLTDSQIEIKLDDVSSKYLSNYFQPYYSDFVYNENDNIDSLISLYEPLGDKFKYNRGLYLDMLYKNNGLKFQNYETFYKWAKVKYPEKFVNTQVTKSQTSTTIEQSKNVEPSENKNLSAFLKLLASSPSNTSTTNLKGSKNCIECNGTGKCRICSKTFQKPYFKNGYYAKRSETKVGYTLCNLCLGKGFQDRNIGSGYEIIGDCSNQKCQDGWVFCYKCNSSGQRNDIGQCRECRGTGRK
jgi:hypothetical protein